MVTKKTGKKSRKNRASGKLRIGDDWNAINIIALSQIIAEQRRAEDERVSRKMLTTIRKAFQEALMVLPAEEYDWFDIQAGNQGRGSRMASESTDGVVAEEADGVPSSEETPRMQKQFFEYAGPLFSVRVAPQSSVVSVNQAKTYRAVARDRSRINVEHDLTFQWRIIEGSGALDNDHSEIVTFNAPDQPELSRIVVTVSQGSIRCEGEGIITVTDSLLPEMRQPAANRHGDATTKALLQRQRPFFNALSAVCKAVELSSITARRLETDIVLGISPIEANKCGIFCGDQRVHYASP